MRTCFVLWGFLMGTYWAALPVALPTMIVDGNHQVGAWPLSLMLVLAGCGAIIGSVLTYKMSK
jgi:hypothetical protein